MNYIDYIVIVSYIIGFLFLGSLFKDSKDSKDYFLGGKSFGWFPLSLSTIATQLSAISFISAPAFVGLKDGGGIMWLTYELAVPLAMIFLMVFLIPPMYKAGVVSVYSYLENRFSTSTRLLVSGVFQVSRAFGTSVMIYAVALILTSVMAIPIWQTILIIGVVTLIYSYQGGMKAVVYGDMIQMIILFFGIIICLIAGLHHLGGWSEFVANVDRPRLTAVNFSSMGFEKGEEFGFWPMLIGGFFLYASYYGTDQSQVQRLFSAKDLGTVKKTLLFNGLLRFPITVIYCLMGLIIGTLVMTQTSFSSAIPVDKPDLMIPIFIRDYLPHGVIGILLVAILSAAMSSLSSAINSLSAATVEDFFNRDKQLSAEKYMKISKLSAIFWGVICILLAFFTGDIAKTVIEAINKVGSVFYGPILATFIAAIGISKINSKGVNIGILAGVATNVYLWLFVPDVFWFWWNAVGAIVTLLVGYIASIIFSDKDKKTSFSKPILEWDKSKLIILLLFFVAIIIFSYFFETFI
ncbi:MAG: SSS family transporter [Saprospiraceae bacterium]|jgi:SSS family transporter|tara:strand:- start:2493 stop:4055 length:1563 start_codon:yes stop_codon:yes gene_type:complete